MEQLFTNINEFARGRRGNIERLPELITKLRAHYSPALVREIKVSARALKANKWLHAELLAWLKLMKANYQTPSVYFALHLHSYPSLPWYITAEGTRTAERAKAGLFPRGKANLVAMRILAGPNPPLAIRIEAKNGKCTYIPGWSASPPWIG